MNDGLKLNKEKTPLNCYQQFKSVLSQEMLSKSLFAFNKFSISFLRAQEKHANCVLGICFTRKGAEYEFSKFAA